MKFRILSTLPVIILAIYFSSCNNTKQSEQVKKYEDGNFISEMNHVLTLAITVDLFPPPVASRIYAYPNIAAYEVMKYTSPSYSSLAPQLNEMMPIPEPPKDVVIDYQLSALVAFMKVGKQLVYTEAELVDYEKRKTDSLSSTMDEDVAKQSIMFGNEVADKILEWASKDNFKETRSAERYSLLKTEGSWLPTPPDYTPAIEPHWQEIRTFLISSADAYRPDSLLIPFSTKKDSKMYQQALDVMNAVVNADSDQVSMARFWDDNPVVTEHTGHMMVKNKKMTPGGHWMHITMLAVRDYKKNMADASLVFAMTSIAIADAFIASWDSKYFFQTIRPVTYIHDNITTDWGAILQTPPFPEHPSAHSTISASAATVLTSLFGDNFAFTDSSEVPYSLPVRSFSSFNEAAHEVAMSRYYGGIHFMFSNEVGVSMGKKIGDAVVAKLDKGLSAEKSK